MKELLSLIAALMISFGITSPAKEEVYLASGEFSIPFSVSLENREPTDEDQWTVRLEGLEEAPMPENCILSVIPGKNGPSMYQFGPILFDQDDIGHEYHYILRIDGPDDPLMTYDTVKSATVRVADNQNGTLNITSYAEQWPPAFRNIYYRATGEKELKLTSSLSGRDFSTGDQWIYYVTADDNVPMPEKTEVVIMPSSGNEIEVSFGKILFSEQDINRTYSYTISESGRADGIQNNIAKTIQIRVNDNGDGTLSAVSSIEETGILFDKEYHSEGSEHIRGTLVISGREFIPGDLWVFELTGEEGSPMPDKKELIIEPTEGYSQELDFGSVFFTEADAGKTFVYDVNVRGENPGIQNAENAELLLEVTDQGDGSLTVSSNIRENMLFRMIYSAHGEFIISGETELTGRALQEGDHWIVQLAPTEEGYPMPETNSVFMKKEGEDMPSFSFAPIQFTEADNGKEYHYIVSEKADIPGITLDKEHLVHVRIKDQYDGTLNIESSMDGKPLSFVNTYDANGSLMLKGEIGLIGRDFLESDSWTAVLSADDGIPMPDNCEYVMNAVPGEQTVHFEFGPIAYTLSDAGKEYQYTLSETGDVPGVVPFEPVEVSVKISDNGNGELSAAAVFPDRIDNLYHADGNMEVVGSLFLNGRTIIDSDSWTVKISGNEGAPLPENPSLTITGGSGNETAFDLGIIRYSEADAGKRFEYVVSANSEMSGVEDGEEYSFAVDVADNADGTLSVTSSLKEEPITLQSTYTATGSTALHGTKRLIGRNYQPGDSWKLILQADEGTPMPIWTEITVNPIFDQNVAFDFGTVSYTEKDIGKTYTYQIISSSDAGGIDEGESQLITVKITDNQDGTLTVYNSSADGLYVTSIYSAKIPLMITGTKIISGREFMDGQIWNITIKGSEGAPLPDKNTVLFNEPDGGNSADFSFDEILFTNEMSGKEFTYTIEESTELSGVSINAPLTFRVNVEDHLDGTMSLKLSSEMDGHFEFRNEYSASADLELSGTLSLQNRSFREDDSWTITLSSESELAPQPETWKTNVKPAEGNRVKYSFGTMHFTEADSGKTYQYTVTSFCEMPGVSGDTNKVIGITVLDKGDGSLDLLFSGGDDPLLLNYYYTAIGTFPVTAVLSMQNRSFLETDQFDFEVSCADPAPMPERLHLTVSPETENPAENLLLSFGSITFTEADIGRTYDYTVSQKTSAPGVDVPEAVTFQISVEDNGDSTLTLTSSLTDLSITNIYHASGELQLEAVIGITGRPFRADDKWTLSLMAEPGSPVPEKNTADAVPEEGTSIFSVDFGKVLFTEADIGKIYTYTVFQNGQITGVKNDTPKSIQVQIDDKGTGDLVLTVAPEANPLFFECIYHAEGSIDLKGVFSIRSRDFLPGDQWSIIINSAEGVPMPEYDRINLKPEKGNDIPVEFGHIRYTEADIGKQYQYIFTEVGTVQSVKNDTDKVLLIQISDNGDGTLSVSTDESSDSLEFMNLYSANGYFSLTGAIRMFGRAFQADETWKVRIEAGEENTPIPEVTELTVVSEKNTTKTAFSFDSIHLTQEDIGKTFHYMVYVSGGNGAIRIDSPKECTMTVGDHGDGTLIFIMDLPAEGLIFENSLRDDCFLSPEIAL